MAPVPRFRDALVALAARDTRFIVVGGVAAVIGGAPVSTFDLDIVHERTAENVGRLVDALRALDASYRDPGGRVLRPEAAALLGPGHHLLTTSAGSLDILGEVVGGRRYEDLLADSHQVSLGELTVHVLGLAAVIRMKEELGRDKDLAALPLLRRTLEQSS